MFCEGRHDFQVLCHLHKSESWRISWLNSFSKSLRLPLPALRMPAESRMVESGPFLCHFELCASGGDQSVPQMLSR